MMSLRTDDAKIVPPSVLDDPLVTLDALADAADRIPATQVEHHLGDLPVVLPGGESITLEQRPADVVRNVATNECWVMLRSLAVLPEYDALLRRFAAPFELALRARREMPVQHDLIAFIAGPRSTVPVHFDRNHHVLLQVRGTKTVGTGVFSDPYVHQLQIECGLQPDRRNADAMPDNREERVLHPGDAVVIPAFTFHWVQGRDDVSIAMACAVGTDVTARTNAVHEFNMRARKLGLRFGPPGTNERTDRAKAKAYSTSKRVRSSVRARAAKVKRIL